ncbi:type IV pilus modification PilV family protein [Parachitinimonas caeni]|uniref:Type IV pilus modification protein PilV n=1 Tax=Parachitinimonas caeni TaxID=3031301 RepID=A0ABT7DSE3_9NEIS|nr:hypothetical protein [Parachitinimonas caeni]MDK2122991.1 hypothetical protein [Parachitinimonas caeni]
MKTSRTLSCHRLPGSSQTSLKQQSGVLLLEGLIAILVFSLGILAMFGLQAAAIKSVGESKYRMDAAFLANQLVGTLWVNKANVTAYNCADPCTSSTQAPLNAWLAQVQTTMPGVDLASSPAKAAPVVAVTSDPSGNGIQVTVTVRWRTSNTQNSAAITHNYTTTAYVNANS